MTLDPLDYLIQIFIPFLVSSIFWHSVCPASTAPVECVFSASGKAIMGKRNVLPEDNLERETLLRKKTITCLF